MELYISNHIYKLKEKLFTINNVEITGTSLKPDDPNYNSIDAFIRSYCKYNEHTILQIKLVINIKYFNIVIT